MRESWVPQERTLPTNTPFDLTPENLSFFCHQISTVLEFEFDDFVILDLFLENSFNMFEYEVKNLFLVPFLKRRNTYC